MPFYLAFIASLIVHVVVLAGFCISYWRSSSNLVLETQPLKVDFVRIGDITSAPPPKPVESSEPEKVKEKEAKKEPETTEPVNKEETAPPKPEPQPIEPPQKDPEPAPTPQPKKKVEKPKEKKKEKPKKPQKKTDPQKALADLAAKKKSDGKKKQSSKEASKALDDLLRKNTSETETGADVGAVSDVVTASEIDAIRQTIRKCWSIPAGARGADNISVDVTLEVGQDGTVTHAEVEDTGRMKSDPVFRSAAESAVRAARDPRCNPLPIPKDKYEQFKKISMNFNPKDMY